MKRAKSATPTRRHFLTTAALSGLGVYSGCQVSLAESPRRDRARAYERIDWDQCRSIGSVSHAHCRSQQSLDLLCRRGLTHLAISNYYPSVPCLPDERSRQYQVAQDFATVDGNGYQRGDFRWNEIIGDPETGWLDKLPEDLRETFPFTLGPPCFSQIPSDIILCPNAEHHSMTDSPGHFNAVGSHFCSGTFDVRGKYKLHLHGYPIGTGLPWRDAFARMLEELEIPDGGGVTINHPRWSRMTPEHLHEMLDFDPRVLGIEIWNHTAEMLNGKGWSLEQWDAILATGRSCFGLAVSDHAHNSDPAFKGRNVLLVDEDTTAEQQPAACLRAYRNGDYYCALSGELQLTRLELTGDSLHVKVSATSQIRILSASGVLHEASSDSCKWKLPTGAAALANNQYLRVEAQGIDVNDQVFSQPIYLS